MPYPGLDPNSCSIKQAHGDHWRTNARSMRKKNKRRDTDGNGPCEQREMSSVCTPTASRPFSSSAGTMTSWACKYMQDSPTEDDSEDSYMRKASPPDQSFHFSNHPPFKFYRETTVFIVCPHERGMRYAHRRREVPNGWKTPPPRQARSFCALLWPSLAAAFDPTCPGPSRLHRSGQELSENGKETGTPPQASQR